METPASTGYVRALATDGSCDAASLAACVIAFVLLSFIAPCVIFCRDAASHVQCKCNPDILQRLSGWSSAACIWLQFSSTHLAGMGGCCAGVFRFVGGSAAGSADLRAGMTPSLVSAAGSADSRAVTTPSLVIAPDVFRPLMECRPGQRAAVLAGAMTAIRRIADGENPLLWGSGHYTDDFRFTFELRPSRTVPNGQELILESEEELTPREPTEW